LILQNILKEVEKCLAGGKELREISTFLFQSNNLARFFAAT
jgi:hypothetical protein